MNLAYVAGIIDGEGCIQFTKCRDIFIPRVLVVNTYLPLLEALEEQFGGHIGKMYRASASWKPAYQWNLSNSKCVEFLDNIYDDLFIKDAQADLVFAWDAIRPGKGRPWTAEGKEALELIVAQSHWLNGRGKDAQSRPEPMIEALAA